MYYPEKQIKFEKTVPYISVHSSLYSRISRSKMSPNWWCFAGYRSPTFGKIPDFLKISFFKHYFISSREYQILIFSLVASLLVKISHLMLFRENKIPPIKITNIHLKNLLYIADMNYTLLV